MQMVHTTVLGMSDLYSNHIFVRFWAIEVTNIPFKFQLVLCTRIWQYAFPYRWGKCASSQTRHCM